MITSHCNDIYLRNILSVEHIMQKLVSVKSPILKITATIPSENRC